MKPMLALLLPFTLFAQSQSYDTKASHIGSRTDSSGKVLAPGMKIMVEGTTTLAPFEDYFDIAPLFGSLFSYPVSSPTIGFPARERGDPNSTGFVLTGHGIIVGDKVYTMDSKELLGHVTKVDYTVDCAFVKLTNKDFKITKNVYHKPYSVYVVDDTVGSYLMDLAIIHGIKSGKVVKPGTILVSAGKTDKVIGGNITTLEYDLDGTRQYYAEVDHAIHNGDSGSPVLYVEEAHGRKKLALAGMLTQGGGVSSTGRHTITFTPFVFVVDSLKLDTPYKHRDLSQAGQDNRIRLALKGEKTRVNKRKVANITKKKLRYTKEIRQKATEHDKWDMCMLEYVLLLYSAILVLTFLALR